MEYRNLGRSGLRVSLVGLGCNNFGSRLDREATNRVVSAALDAGITLFDTADTYGQRGGSETLLGECLGKRRKDIVLASKFGLPMDDSGRLKGGARRYVMEAVDASLRRLGTDWIDLYQFHRPDPLTPIEETLRALDDLVRQGKVRYIGCSDFAAWQLVEAHFTADRRGLHPFISSQYEYNLLVRTPEAELLPVMADYGIGLLPYYPLASGLLTGKYRRGTPRPDGARLTLGGAQAEKTLTETNLEIVEGLEAFCAARGRTLLELAFGWLASRPAVSSVIAGASTPEQIAANVAAVDWRLSDDELAEIDQLTGQR